MARPIRSADSSSGSMPGVQVCAPEAPRRDASRCLQQGNAQQSDTLRATRSLAEALARLIRPFRRSRS